MNISNTSGTSSNNLSLGNAFGTSNSNNTSSMSNLISSNNSSTMNSKDFINSNSMISKIVFIILAVVLFVILFRLGMYILNYFLSPSKTPILINGLINGNNSYIIEVDPNIKDSQPIFRSDNQDNGIEFTYNSWIFIDNIFYQKDKYQHIFHKGDDDFNNSPSNKPGISFPNNCPGVYIAPNSNVLSIMMNNYKNVIEEIQIDNIPTNKWICLTIRVQNKTIDVYVNGTLSKRHTMMDIPRQNYGKIYCGQQGGFGGYLSKLQYWDYAINYNTIQNVVRSGPNLTSINDNMDAQPPYLAMRWYYDELQQN